LEKNVLRFQVKRTNRQRQRSKPMENQTWTRQQTRALLMKMKEKKPEAAHIISMVLGIMDMEGKNVKLEYERNQYM
jgi:hypothetical protein